MHLKRKAPMPSPRLGAGKSLGLCSNVIVAPLPDTFQSAGVLAGKALAMIAYNADVRPSWRAA